MGVKSLHRIEREACDHSGIDGHGGGREHQGIAIGRGASDEIHADDRVRARTIVDHDGLAPSGGELLRDETGKHVGRPAGGVGDDEANGTRRIGLRGLARGSRPGSPRAQCALQRAMRSRRACK